MSRWSDTILVRPPIYRRCRRERATFLGNRSESPLFRMTDGIPLDADARERRQQLERIAFGRTHSRHDEAAAAAARKELAENDRAAQVAAQQLAARDTAPRRVTPDDLGGQEPPPNPAIPPPPPPEPPHKIARRMRSAWLVPIVAASIAFGYFGSTAALTSALQEPVLLTDPGVPSPDLPSPTRTAPSNGSTSAGGPSSLKEADAWFETLPRDGDPVVDPAILANLGIDPSAIRFVQINAAGSQVWVARKLDGDLCVIGTEARRAAAVHRLHHQRGFCGLRHHGHTFGRTLFIDLERQHCDGVNAKDDCCSISALETFRRWRRRQDLPIPGRERAKF